MPSSILSIASRSKLIGPLNAALGDINRMAQRVRLAMYSIALLKVKSGPFMDLSIIIRSGRLPYVMEKPSDKLYLRHAGLMMLQWLVLIIMFDHACGCCCRWCLQEE